MTEAFVYASFVNQTAEIEADLLLRLASNRCVYGAPPAYRGRGAPAKHGHKMKLNDHQTWTLPNQSLEVLDPQLGRVRVSHTAAVSFPKIPQATNGNSAGRSAGEPQW